MIPPKKLDNLQVNKPGIEEIANRLAEIDDHKGKDPEAAILAQRVRIPRDKIDRALQYWKPRYFEYFFQGRNVNGIEAYELGDPKRYGDSANSVPYIAMCNIMALEALIMMGEQSPTMESAQRLGFGSEREKEIADHWKKRYAPTAFQAEWAWKACMALLAGDPYATADMLEKFQDQLPDG